MKKIRKIQNIIALALVVIAMSLMLIIVIGKRGGTKSITKVGFVMTGATDEDGWNGMHYEGIKAACKNLNATLIVKENISENTGECVSAVEDLIDNGCEVIFLTSYGYVDELEQIIKDHPNVFFYSESASNFQEKNLNIYFARMYQARYLSGLIAGKMTKTNHIGYIAAMPNSEVNRGINAFTLGVKYSNPNATVYVSFTDSWSDEEVEKQHTRDLVEGANIDVVTYHQNMPFVCEAADELGIYSISYHMDMVGENSSCIASVVCNWEKLYTEILGLFLSGKSSGSKAVWLGVDKEVVAIGSYSDLVESSTKNMVMDYYNRMCNGTDVFSNKIIDNNGNLRCGEGEMMSDEELLTEIDWFVEGVVIYEK